MISDTRTERRTDERLSEAEVHALRRRFEGQPGKAVDLETVAEAAGLDLEVVREHLRQIRTERAFLPQRTKGPDRAPWLLGITAMLALGIGGAITWRRIQAENPLRYGTWQPPQTGQITPSVVRNVQQNNRSLPAEWIPRGVGAPPPGFRISVASPTRELVGDGESSENFPRPYEQVRDQLVRAIESFAGRSSSTSTKTEGPFRGWRGTIFEIEPGNVFYRIEGWAGEAEGQLAVPLTPAGHAQIVKAAEGVIAEPLAKQNAALGSPTGEIVSPPPGFRFVFGGRRTDEQLGPRITFAPIPVVQVRERLEAALLNAVHRDARPPLGAWTEDAAREAKIPTPKRYAGSIEGPGGTIPFDIPSSPQAALRRGIREVAEKAAHQVDPINARAAASAPTDTPPPDHGTTTYRG